MFLKDVIEFHRKFGIEGGNYGNTVVRNLLPDEIRFRLGFLFEEFAETAKASGLKINKDILELFVNEIKNSEVDTLNYDGLEVIDGLLDLVYVALGTLDLKELSETQIRSHWTEIQRANMSKERSTGANDARSKRKHSLDIVKPDGWKGPDHNSIMDKAVKNSLRKESDE